MSSETGSRHRHVLEWIGFKLAISASGGNPFAACEHHVELPERANEVAKPPCMRVI
jgi:hypothetical protein